jgi:Flp pilus assembly protein TadG
VIGRRAHRAHGQALVEAALAVTLLVVLTACLVDVARAVWEYNTVAFLARDGARYGTIPTHLDVKTAGGADVESYVQRRCGSMSLGSCQVAVIRSTCGDGSVLMRVTVTSAFSPLTPGIADVWPSRTFDLTAASQMFVEGAALRMARDPGASDNTYPTGTFWINTVTNKQFEYTQLNPTWRELPSGSCPS